jgi:hypothetical protein
MHSLQDVMDYALSSCDITGLSSSAGHGIIVHLGNTSGLAGGPVGYFADRIFDSARLNKFCWEGKNI